MAYYTATGNPGTQTSGRSASIRNEFLLIQQGLGDAESDIQALAALIGVPLTIVEQPVASAATTDIGNGYGPVLLITGTTAITSMGANYNGVKFLRFSGALTLTHSASLVLPGAANFTTAAGDSCYAVPIGSPATGWRLVGFTRYANPNLVDDAVRKSDTGLQTIAGNVGVTGDLTVTGAFSASSFPAANLSGTVAVANGGTGASTPVNARSNLGAATAGALASSGITGAVATGSITTSGLTQATARMLGRTTASTGAVEEISVGSSLSLATGSLGVADAGITPSKLSGAQTGSAPAFACRAYCIFDGTVAGTNAPLNGGNVTSVTRNGAGDYTINFTTALPSANYIAVFGGLNTSGTNVNYIVRKLAGTKTTSAFQIVCVAGDRTTFQDNTDISIAIFG